MISTDRVEYQQKRNSSTPSLSHFSLDTFSQRLARVCCMCEAPNKQLANKYASEDRQEVPNVHAHDSEHAISSLVSRYPLSVRPNLQQISHADNDRSERRPRQVHTQPPRPVPTSAPSHRARSTRVHRLRSAQLAFLIPICLRRDDERSLRFRLLAPYLPH